MRDFIAAVTATLALTFAVPTIAGASNVQVTITNLESYPIIIVKMNICGTAAPRPPTSIAALKSFTYTNNNCSIDVNSGHITYKNSYPLAAGACAFNYASFNELEGGSLSWVFSNSALPTGHTLCTSKITSQNSTTGDFVVVFTMRSIF